MTTSAMHDFLRNAVRLYPDHTAIEEPGRHSITYRELDRLAESLRDYLRVLGVHRGDRVGIYMHKSIDSVAAIAGILKAGAAYVPVDPTAPVTRNAYILSDCSVKAVITENSLIEVLTSETGKYGAHPHIIGLDEVGGGKGLQKALDQRAKSPSQSGGGDEIVSPDDLAYILYTSGSTGKPKGVMLSHINGTSFVHWCAEALQPVQSDRFSSHAPFHFDLSILDIFLTFYSGGTLVLVSEEIGKDPVRLAPLISNNRISVWYSAPSILTFLVQYGNLEKYDYSALRTVLFAGEVFPVKHLRALHSILPKPRYFNLYGPTETNVCTYYEIPSQIPADRTEPYPIGKVCSHLLGKVVNEEGQEIGDGKVGELCIRGPAVMQGYWNLPDQSGRAFLDPSGERWYRTGDIVTEDADKNYILIGRRDRMVKRRGYRVELGEIGAALYRHPVVKEAAVVALPNQETGVSIRAFLSCNGGRRPSTIEMKQFCMDLLPPYMVPDLFSFRETLPKTSTDKIDYQTLKDSN